MILLRADLSTPFQRYASYPHMLKLKFRSPGKHKKHINSHNQAYEDAVWFAWRLQIRE